jgi:hypothetical protein
MIFWGLVISFARAEDFQGTVLEQGTKIPLSVGVQCGETLGRSDKDGRFLISGICESLWFISPNHYPAEVSIAEFNRNHVAVLQAKMTQEEIIIEEERLPTHSQTYALLTEDLERTPGGFDDSIVTIITRSDSDS